MWTSTNALTLTHQLIKLYHRCSIPILEKFTLSQAEMDILAFLHNNPQYDTAKEICDIRFMKKSIVSQSLDKLVKYGYIDKKHDKSDKRIIHLTITNNAQECIAAISDMQKDFFSNIFSSYTAEDNTALVCLLDKLSVNISKLAKE